MSAICAVVGVTALSQLGRSANYSTNLALSYGWHGCVHSMCTCSAVHEAHNPPLLSHRHKPCLDMASDQAVDAAK